MPASPRPARPTRAAPALAAALVLAFAGQAPAQAPEVPAPSVAAPAPPLLSVAEAARLARVDPLDPASDWIASAPADFGPGVDPETVAVAPAFAEDAAWQGARVCLTPPDGGEALGYWTVTIRAPGPLAPGVHPFRIAARRAATGSICGRGGGDARPGCAERERRAGDCALIDVALRRPGATFVAPPAVRITAVSYGALAALGPGNRVWSDAAEISALGGPRPTLLDPGALDLTLLDAGGEAQPQTLRLAPEDGKAPTAMPENGPLRLRPSFPEGYPRPGVYTAVLAPASPDAAGRPVEVAVTVTVRYWAGYLLLAILLGVLFGWLIRVWLARRAARAAAAALAAPIHEEILAQADRAADADYREALNEAAAALGQALADDSLDADQVEAAAREAAAERDKARAALDARVKVAREWLAACDAAADALRAAGPVAAAQATTLRRSLARLDGWAEEGDFAWWGVESRAFDEQAAPEARDAILRHARATEDALARLARAHPDLAPKGVEEARAAAAALAATGEGATAHETLALLAAPSAALEVALREKLCGDVADYALDAADGPALRAEQAVREAATAVENAAFPAAESMDAVGFARLLESLGAAARAALEAADDLSSEAREALAEGRVFEAALAGRGIAEGIMLESASGASSRRSVLRAAPPSPPTDRRPAGFRLALPARGHVGGSVEARVVTGPQGATAPEGRYGWRYGGLRRTGGPTVRIPLTSPGALRVEATDEEGRAAVAVIEVDATDPAISPSVQRRLARRIALVKGVLVSALIVGTGFLLHRGDQIDLMTLALAFSWGFAVNLTEETLTEQLARLKAGPAAAA